MRLEMIPVRGVAVGLAGAHAPGFGVEAGAHAAAHVSPHGLATGCPEQAPLNYGTRSLGNGCID